MLANNQSIELDEFQTVHTSNQYCLLFHDFLHVCFINSQAGALVLWHGWGIH